LPGVSIGKGSKRAADAIVMRDAPEEKLAIGSPAKIRELLDEIVRKK
jgi:acetyltransferase-like isoleucine patch superfamily enzyme